MKRLHVWLLRRMVRAIVRQGFHRGRIIMYYQFLVEAAVKEFTEDNTPTLRRFLEECHTEALDSTGLEIHVPSHKTRKTV